MFAYTRPFGRAFWRKRFQNFRIVVADISMEYTSCRFYEGRIPSPLVRLSVMVGGHRGFGGGATAQGDDVEFARSSLAVWLNATVYRLIERSILAGLES